jgi:spermidine synthase
MNRPTSRTPVDVHPDVTMSEHDGVRYLHLGTPWVQGAMRLDAPSAIELAYVQRMMAWLLWRDVDELKSLHAVQLGLGAGAITKFCRQVLGMKTTVVELNPKVVGANRAWFRLPREDARFKVVVGDARAWVDDAANAGCADVLCVDLYDHEAAAPVLDDRAFYESCQRTLAAGGLMTVNLFGRRAALNVSSRCLAELFGLDQLWQMQPTREGNTILVVAKGVTVPDREALMHRADTIESRFGLPARKWLRMVRPVSL